MAVFTVEKSPEFSLMKGTNQALSLQEGEEEREKMEMEG